MFSPLKTKDFMRRTSPAICADRIRLPLFSREETTRLPWPGPRQLLQRPPPMHSIGFARKPVATAPLDRPGRSPSHAWRSDVLALCGRMSATAVQQRLPTFQTIFPALVSWPAPSTVRGRGRPAYLIPSKERRKPPARASFRQTKLPVLPRPYRFCRLR